MTKFIEQSLKVYIFSDNILYYHNFNINIDVSQITSDNFIIHH